MALIACPDCHTQVSDSAPACPKCSRPMKATTIEATGKQWKMMQLAGVCATFGGCVAIMNVDSTSGPSVVAMTLFVAGLGMMVFGRVGAWWHHG